MSAADTEFARLTKAIEEDERVLGLLLAGSRGIDPDYVTELSDYDAYVIVTDEQARDDYAKRFPSQHGDAVEVIVATLDSFRAHALPGSASEWNAYTFAHVTPTLDRLDGEVARLAAEKAKRDPATAAPEPLDGYINLYYRSAKNWRDGRSLEARLDAAESVPWFVDFLFAAFGRVRPYNKWLPWELRHHPLPPPWTAEHTLSRIEAIIQTGSITQQQTLFRDAERLSRSTGFGEIIDGWELDLDWLRGHQETQSDP